MKRAALFVLTAAIAATPLSPAFAYSTYGLGEETTSKVDLDKLLEENRDKVDFNELRDANRNKVNFDKLRDANRNKANQAERCPCLG